MLASPIRHAASAASASASASLKGRTAFISGASRGIGLAIGLGLAREGANVVVAAKTAEPHPKLPGTIHTAAAEIERAGGKALALQVDVRSEEAVKEAIAKTVERFGGLDILINNASAINLQPAETLPMKSFDLMHSINARGTYMLTHHALPHLLASAEAGRNPHILTLSPPLQSNVVQRHFSGCTGYAMAKYAMSLAMLGVAGETSGEIAANCLWPYTTVGTSAMLLVDPSGKPEKHRAPEIMAEAAVRIFKEDAKTFSGNFLIDELYLRRPHPSPTVTPSRLTNAELAKFATVPMDELGLDLFISDQIVQEVEDARKRDGLPGKWPVAAGGDGLPAGKSKL